MTTLHVHTPPSRTSTSRALARSLLLEALTPPGTVPLPVVLPSASVTRLVPALQRVPGGRYTRETLQATLAAFFARHGRLPTRGEWRASGRYGLPTPATVQRHYGSQAALYAAMGCDLPQRRTGNQYTRTIKETRSPTPP